ncbi:hypothetical protein CXG45_01005 [Pseudomonas plecoglossicida]|uniref:Uncharacterized protein n=1 Tax=Pseudomonas plecoglossicida TaxID=70775 RepID=A0ABX4U1R2_PSEDL|nr:hypothetical protein CXG44_07575 [Pseudomonas plecoglossicida]PLU95648.1 hypothetical protein CXG45_01005 [Pseudomonas plecoglossicida]PLV07036.1 hypothetical protein CXG48_02255 [Pseudomonas plecoglossicida]PLV14626.1 hypothetical protein CXG47_11355 [Pseudomonas plecoglossicida]
MVYRAVGEVRGQHGAGEKQGQSLWLLRGRARSHRPCAGSEACGVPVGAGKPAKRPAQVMKIGNFLHIHETAGTIRYICCHTCAKTQHKPLSQKKMHAQIAAI